MYKHPAIDYLRYLPTLFCPGCGIGIIMHARIEAVKELGIPREKLVNVSGIGCSGRIPQHILTDGVHTVHGRAIAVATAIKLARPDLYVTVRTGDGDNLAIGGNHFIHAARRNIDLLVIMVNNRNYGMTGGQLAPTTPHGASTTTTPYGNLEDPFNAVKLAASAGATYVARRTVAHFIQLKNSIKKGLSRKGFSFIEVISPCTSRFIRRNKANYKDFFNDLRMKSEIKYHIDPSEAVIDRDPKTRRFKKIIVGEFVEIDRPSYVERYEEYRKRAMEEKKRSGTDPLIIFQAKRLLIIAQKITRA